MRFFAILVLVLLIASNQAFSQLSLNTDGSQADPSAMLDVKSTSKGLLIPRMNIHERNNITNPAEGLIVFCTNCGLNGTGMLCLYTGGEWFSFSLCQISAPAPGVNLLPSSAIVWNWNQVPGALGYKWGTTNALSSAIDMGTDTSKTETGINCDSLYSRYVWAYSDCGYSAPVTLTQSNSNCWTCGQAISIDHITGNVAPVNKSTTYATVNNVPGEPAKCWITSNLGSDHQASAYDDYTEASSGWYWQFNRMQGFKHDGIAQTPASTWITSIIEYYNWTFANDPCALELGNGWRIPTKIEWENVDTEGGWGTYNGPWNSVLKIHMAGYLYSSNGSLRNRGSDGFYWSSTQSSEELAWKLLFSSGNCGPTTSNKAFGTTLRCIKD